MSFEVVVQPFLPINPILKTLTFFAMLTDCYYQKLLLHMNIGISLEFLFKSSMACVRTMSWQLLWLSGRGLTWVLLMQLLDCFFSRCTRHWMTECLGCSMVEVIKLFLKVGSK